MSTGYFPPYENLEELRMSSMLWSELNPKPAPGSVMMLSSRTPASTAFSILSEMNFRA